MVEDMSMSAWGSDLSSSNLCSSCEFKSCWLPPVPCVSWCDSNLGMMDFCKFLLPSKVLLLASCSARFQLLD